jgi:hypothetical protein
MQLSQALGDIGTLKKQGIYRDVAVVSKAARVEGPTRRFRCVDLRITKNDGAASYSLLCLSAKDGNFVKLRYTGPDKNATRKRASEFVAQTEATIWSP